MDLLHISRHACLQSVMEKLAAYASDSEEAPKAIAAPVQPVRLPDAAALLADARVGCAALQALSSLCSLLRSEKRGSPATLSALVKPGAKKGVPPGALTWLLPERGRAAPRAGVGRKVEELIPPQLRGRCVCSRTELSSSSLLDACSRKNVALVDRESLFSRPQAVQAQATLPSAKQPT